MKVGYAHLSGDDRTTDLKIEALKNAGCEELYFDKTKTFKDPKPTLLKLKGILKPKDVLVVWRLDCLARSLQDLLNWAQYFEENEISFESLEDDLKSSLDISFLTACHTIRNFQETLETQRNISISRKAVGRKPSISEEIRKEAIKLYQSKNVSTETILEILGISRPSLYHILKTENISPSRQSPFKT